jgi:hypothetical protein
MLVSILEMLQVFRFKSHYRSKGGVKLYSVKHLYRDKCEECSNKSVFSTVKTHSPLLKKFKLRKQTFTVVPVFKKSLKRFLPVLGGYHLFVIFVG